METSEILLLILCIEVLVALAGIAYVGFSVAKTSRKVQVFLDWLNSVQPTLEKTIHEVQSGLADFKQVTDILHDVASDVQEVTGAAKKIVLPPLLGMDRIQQSIKSFLSKMKSKLFLVSGKNGGERVRSSHR